MSEPSFIAIQKSFSAYIRAPQQHPVPLGIPPQRMQIYADLFYNNVQNLLASSFPVLRQVLDDNQWHSLIRAYFAEHLAHTPLFPQIAREFLRYLEDTRGLRAGDWPFLLELAHYEWVELALAIDPREIPDAGFDAKGDLLAGKAFLSPLAWPLAYCFPVHKISPAYKPSTAPAQAIYLLVYRNCADAVRFLELNPVSARLIELLGQDLSGRQALQQIAEELAHPQPVKVIDAGRQILEDLRARDVILGVRSA
jgi:uncharacterized protein